MLNILLVEDNADGAKAFQILLADVWGSSPLKYEVTLCMDVARAMEKAALGVFPLAFVDLHVPDYRVGAGKTGDPFPGWEIAKCIRMHNKDAVICIYTANAEKEIEKGVKNWNLATNQKQLVDSLIDKSSNADKMEESLMALFHETKTKFNLAIDVNMSDIKDLCFGNAGADGHEDQWEICLRHIFVDAQGPVLYDVIGNGRSGAKVVSAYATGQLPKILKFDQFEKLQNELRKYELYVRDFVRRRPETSNRSLAQAGGQGVLAYTFVGFDDKPITMGDLVDKGSAKAIEAAISDHSSKNCEIWFAGNGLAAPYDLASECRSHFKVRIDRLEELFSNPLFERAVQNAAAAMQKASHIEVTETIIRAVQTTRRKLRCKPPVTIHGDLNVNNLIWDGHFFWLIDFGRTGEGMRMIDFVKLEASLKFDVPIPNTTVSEDRQISDLVAFEDALIEKFVFQNRVVNNRVDSDLRNRLSAIGVVRQCAQPQCGPNADIEYWLALFFVTAKHIEYLGEDFLREGSKFTHLVHALVSCYRLAGKIASTAI